MLHTGLCGAHLGTPLRCRGGLRDVEWSFADSPCALGGRAPVSCAGNCSLVIIPRLPGPAVAEAWHRPTFSREPRVPDLHRGTQEQAAGQILTHTSKATLSCARQEQAHRSACRPPSSQDTSLRPLCQGWTGLSQDVFLSSSSWSGVLPSTQADEKAGPEASARPWPELPVAGSPDQDGHPGQVDTREWACSLRGRGEYPSRPWQEI